MSNIQRYENLNQIIVKTETDFNALAKIHGAVNFKREAGFAMQILSENSYTAEQAAKDPDALRFAVLNVAAIGLTLSPVLKLAYLVPRKGKVCLDISYQGKKQLGIECGAIVLCKADLVYGEDNFILKGFDEQPIHEYKPFSKNRGEILGGYCTAKTPNGDWITVTMELQEIEEIKKRSESFKSGKGSPWLTDYEEMAKKTLIHRGYKEWPKSGTPEQKERLAQAMESDKEDFIDTTATAVVDEKPNEYIETIKTLLTELKRKDEDVLKHLTAVCKREIKSFENLTPIESTQFIAQLNQWIKGEKKKANESKKTEIKDANPTNDSSKKDRTDEQVKAGESAKKKDAPIDFLVVNAGEMICSVWKSYNGTMIKDIETDSLIEFLSIMDKDSERFKFTKDEIDFYNNSCTFLGRARSLKEKQ